MTIDAMNSSKEEKKRKMAKVTRRKKRSSEDSSSEEEHELERVVFGVQSSRVLNEWAASIKKDDEENATTSDNEAPEEVSSKAPANAPLWHDPDDQAFEKDVRKRQLIEKRKSIQPAWADTKKAKKTAAKRRRKRDRQALGVEASSSSDTEGEAATAALCKSTARVVERVSSSQPIPGGRMLAFTSMHEPTWGVRTFKPTTGLMFHPDAPLLVHASSARKIMLLKVNATRAEESLLQAIGIEDFIISDCKLVSANRSALMASYNKPHLYRYDFDTGKAHKRALPTRAMGCIKPQRLDVSADQQSIVVHGLEDNDGRIAVVDAKTYEWIGTLQESANIVGAQYHPEDARKLFLLTTNGIVALWDARYAKSPVARIRDDGCVRATTLHARRNMLAVGSNTGIVNVYESSEIERQSVDIADLKPLWTLTTMRTAASALQWSTTTDLLAVASDQMPNSMRIANMRARTTYSNFPPKSKKSLGKVFRCAFSPGGAYFAAGDEIGRVGLYRLNHYECY